MLATLRHFKIKLWLQSQLSLVSTSALYLACHGGGGGGGSKKTWMLPGRYWSGKVVSRGGGEGD